MESLIEKSHIKYRDFNSERELEAFGVSNTEGITRTTHRRSDDLEDYLVIQPGSIAYNPYRVNVGSIGLTPDGVYGLVSPAYVVFRAKERELVPEVLLDFLKSSEGLRQINKLARGTVRKALRFDELCKIDFPTIPYDQQIKILERKQNFNQQHRRLLSEITRQETLLGKLKQAILQDAIQGKLTAAWRKENPEVEPASQLLERIRKEKQHLIAEKKLRKEKPLPPISLTEIPFKIPKGWEWCRLDDILNVRAGIAKGGKRYTGSIRPTPYLRVANVQRGYLELDQVKLLDLPGQEAEKYALQNDDLLVTEGGDPDKVGRCAVWHNEIEGCIHQNHIFCMRPNLRLSVETDFVPLILNSPFCQDYFLGSYKQTTNLASINKTVLRSTPIALPSFVEQAFIIKQVKMLMTTCQVLETEIEKSRSHAVHLLQTVLKESFNRA
ncbi:MAG: restriction endonuclease subunit S [Gammaproteobacteria bacterium]|nr:restriction endonuclease subunit S [Gammaproteobacteria bacterium]